MSDKKRLLKLVKGILQNPRDVDFNTLQRLLEGFGFSCRQPRGGSSHYTFTNPERGRLTVPKHKPVGVCYVKEVIELLELETWYEQNN